MTPRYSHPRPAPSQLNDPELFPDWVHVIERVENFDSRHEAWSGRLRAIKEHVNLLEAKVEESELRLVGTLSEKFRRLRDEVCIPQLTKRDTHPQLT